MYFTEFTSRLSLKYFSNFQIICSRRKTIYTFLVAKLKEMKCPRKSLKFKIAMKGIYFFFCIYDNRPWHFLRCRFLSCLVELLLAIFWAVFTRFSRFYASPRICSSFRNRKEPMAHFQKRFCLFLALQQATMALKTLLNDIVENFVNRC